MISSISIRALLGITGCLRVSSPGSMPDAISNFFQAAAINGKNGCQSALHLKYLKVRAQLASPDEAKARKATLKTLPPILSLPPSTTSPNLKKRLKAVSQAAPQAA